MKLFFVFAFRVITALLLMRSTENELLDLPFNRDILTSACALRNLQ